MCNVDASSNSSIRVNLSIGNIHWIIYSARIATTCWWLSQTCYNFNTYLISINVLFVQQVVYQLGAIKDVALLANPSDCDSGSQEPTIQSCGSTRYTAARLPVLRQTFKAVDRQVITLIWLANKSNWAIKPHNYQTL